MLLNRFLPALVLACFALLGSFAAFAQTKEDQAAWKALRQPGAIVLFRHAIAPGGGDPPGMVLNDCSTQRNLDEQGRAQAMQLGARFKAQSIKVSEVMSSQWCRTRETARLAFPDVTVKDAPAFNSFFANRESEPAQTAAALKQLLAWRGPGTLVVVTHQVNISALTGVVPASGEGVIVKKKGDKLDVVARLSP